MNYMSTKEAAVLWNVSERMVRLYCTEGRIPEAVQQGEFWFIPAGASKPKRKVVERVVNPKENLTAFAKRVVYQRSKNNHYGIYEYIQVNLTYSSNRMASNRPTRNEVEEVYRSNKITTAFEPVKVDDISETINHFSAVRYVVDNISAPLTQAFIKNCTISLHTEPMPTARKISVPVSSVFQKQSSVFLVKILLVCIYRFVNSINDKVYSFVARFNFTLTTYIPF